LSQDYGFEYSDDDAGEEAGGADMENMYYKAKGTPPITWKSLLHPYMSLRSGKKDDDPEGALRDFRAIVSKEEEKADWCDFLLILKREERFVLYSMRVL
jgi:COP9 signalosome complex subunit 2